MLEAILWTLYGSAALLSAGHALLHKRDPRAGLGWIVACLALPVAGVFFYWVLGVNRVRRRALGWHSRKREASPLYCPWTPDLAGSTPFGAENFASLLALTDAVTGLPILGGNRVEVLHNGEGVYPSMLEAIASARSEICLSTYIFDSDDTGRKMVNALSAAAEGGVEVRILVDALGERYSRPPIRRLFEGRKVRIARFGPPSVTGRGIHLNLRNHRKLLIVDGKIGFTGGMNIGDRHLARNGNPRRVVDLHFQVNGPVVGQLRETFAEDWQFVTGERIGEAPYPPPVAGGKAFCRGISAGPDEDLRKLSWILIGALGCARRRLRIMTPYFIPTRALISAINAAALRGVEVELILPAKNNLPYVRWASLAYLWELLQYGTRIFFQPPPFVHSKFLLVDDDYALVGSANLDPRSLRLNFEFNLEIYDRTLTAELAAHFEKVRNSSRQTSLAEMDARPLPQKLRDSFARLFSPYLS